MSLLLDWFRKNWWVDLYYIPSLHLFKWIVYIHISYCMPNKPFLAQIHLLGQFHYYLFKVHQQFIHHMISSELKIWKKQHWREKEGDMVIHLSVSHVERTGTSSMVHQKWISQKLFSCWKSRRISQRWLEIFYNRK